jgi:hypothetical protein
LLASIVLVGIFNLKRDTPGINRFADDWFLFSALGYVVVCYLVFFAAQQLHSSRLLLWARSLIDCSEVP